MLQSIDSTIDRFTADMATIIKHDSRRLTTGREIAL
jgi:hypothetical protein